jgi:hypothetical protein
LTIDWTPERTELLGLLREQHDDVADLYEQAVNALSVDPLARCYRRDFLTTAGV